MLGTTNTNNDDNDTRPIDSHRTLITKNPFEKSNYDNKQTSKSIGPSENSSLFEEEKISKKKRKTKKLKD
jgi:hypothetical protein